MSKRCWLPLLLALVVAALPLALLTILMGRYQTATILVPRAEIDRCAVVQAGDLMTAMWPVNGLFAGVVVEAGDVVGRLALAPLTRNAPMSRASLVDPADAASVGCPAP